MFIMMQENGCQTAELGTRLMISNFKHTLRDKAEEPNNRFWNAEMYKAEVSLTFLIAELLMTHQQQKNCLSPA